MSKKCLVNFTVLRPKYESSQEETLKWIHASHLQSEVLQNPDLTPEKLAVFSNLLQRMIVHVCCKPDAISFRGHELFDITHTNWEKMSIYKLLEMPKGEGLTKRQEFHRLFVEEIFESYYKDEIRPPNDIVHVSCTGYASPSGAQKIAAKKGWSGKTTITHLYHMGCYAAIPAIRVAGAFVEGKDSIVDVVHTELCTLHHNPSRHEPQYLVAQSLFADGYIKYSLVDEARALTLKTPYFEMIASHEELIPNSAHSMEWLLTDSGFHFLLEKDIPLHIAAHLQSYVQSLAIKAGIPLELLLNQGHIAVHPGGPKIIESTQKILHLKDEQLSTSREILKKYGNMSSATLPHMWDSILNNKNIENGTYILSIAFGPGLTIAGAILQKKGQS